MDKKNGLLCVDITAKRERTHGCKIVKQSFSLLQMFDVGVFSYSANAPSVNDQFLPYACEDAHVDQTKFNFDSSLQFRNGFQKQEAVNFIFNKNLIQQNL